MNLWILSQDEKKLLCINSGCLWIDDTCTYLDKNTRNPEKNFEIWHDETILGEYDTMDRAHEVFMEIFKRIDPSCEIKGNYQDADISVKVQMLSNMIKIYRMPKE